MGVIQAMSHGEGSSPVCSDWRKSSVSTVTISDANFLSSLQGIRLGPAALDGLMSSSSFLTPSSPMTSSGIGGYDGNCSLYSLNGLF